MEEVVERCRRADCYKIQLLSREHRTSAHVFYEGLGFQPSAKGFRLYLA
jgi:GNAT superfamily N-acetyltransferase